MYFHLNLIVNELNSIGLNKLGDAEIVRKIISMLQQNKYARTLAMVIGKLVAFEM
jgi:hypothetical protein